MCDKGDMCYWHRKSPRAKWSEYAGGLYFVTIVTEKRIPYLGKIDDGTMCLYQAGQISHLSILKLESIYPYCKVLNFVIMPNHIHMVIFIDEKKLPYSKHPLNIVNEDSLLKNKAPKSVGWLSHVIGHLKSYITKIVRGSGVEFGWQKRYHDHVIRNMDDFLSISNYIDNNVKNWESDCFNEKMD